jgi:hypothetical protein
VPNSAMETSRYDDRVLLIILESYVLAAIGRLPRKEQNDMRSLVRRSFGGDGDWMATVRSAVSLPESIDEELRTLWSRSQRAAEASKSVLEPLEFAKMVADENFLHLFDTPPPQ